MHDWPEFILSTVYPHQKDTHLSRTIGNSTVDNCHEKSRREQLFIIPTLSLFIYIMATEQRWIPAEPSHILHHEGNNLMNGDNTFNTDKLSNW